MKIICIDPGHGGLDPGGGSNSQWKEKELVFKISNEQKRHFERNGIKVVMTRTSDEYLDSGPRTNRVKASGAKYCISNHINAGGGEGAETIHSIYANPSIAEGILNGLVAWGANRRRAFSKRGTSGDWYYMHRMTGSVNTVIVEYGFADHASDTKKIMKNWQAYAEIVAKYYVEQVFKQKYLNDKMSISSVALPKEELKLYKPTSSDIVNSTATVLRRLEQKKDSPISPQWREKLLEGTLTNSDAIGLLFVAIERGHIEGIKNG